jgi:hypothetical protein
MTSLAEQPEAIADAARRALKLQRQQQLEGARPLPDLGRWCGVIVKPVTSKRGSAFAALAPPGASAAVVAPIANGSPTSAFMVRLVQEDGSYG